MATLKDPFDRRTVSWLLGETISVPVRVREDGRVEFYYGGNLPKMQEGTIGILQVPKDSFTDYEGVDGHQDDRLEQFLEPKSVVMFSVNGSDTPDELRKYLIMGNDLGIHIPYLVEIKLGDSPLNLRIHGTNRASLARVQCQIPALNADAKSLNHAYRLVSEQFEPTRISHTGNVFEVGFCKQRNEWISLESHRVSIENRYGFWRKFRWNS